MARRLWPSMWPAIARQLWIGSLQLKINSNGKEEVCYVGATKVQLELGTSRVLYRNTNMYALMRFVRVEKLRLTRTAQARQNI